MHQRSQLTENNERLVDVISQLNLKRASSEARDPSSDAGLEGVAPRYSRFKIRQLALVQKLLETENLHEAAAALSMSQPAATKLLQEIEEALGSVLFIRQARGMKPTSAGIMVARHAGLILTELRKMQQSVNGLHKGITGHVNIGAIMAAVHSTVTEALVEMTNAHPSVEISLSVGTSDVLQHELQAGRLDFVIASIAGAEGGEPLTFSPLVEEATVVVCGMANPLLRQHDLSLKDIFAERWILPPAGAPELRSIELAFRAAGLPMPVNSMRMASMIATSSVVGSTDMLAAVPDSVYRYFSKFQVLGLVDVELGASAESYGLINVSSRPLGPAARGLYDLILSRARRSKEVMAV